MNSIAPSHLQQEPPFTWRLCQLRFYQALISCANHMLNAQQGPRLKDDAPAAVATNRCVGYEIAMMDEHRIFIENETDNMDPEELAPIKSSIERQAEELKGKHEQFVAEAPSWRREWLPKAMTAVPNTASSPPALSRQPRCGLPQRRESTLGCCGGRAFGRAPLAPRSHGGPFESVLVDGGGVCRHEAAVIGRRRAERKLAVQFQVGRACPPVVHLGNQLGVVQNVVDPTLTARDEPVAWY